MEKQILKVINSDTHAIYQAYTEEHIKNMSGKSVFHEGTKWAKNRQHLLKCYKAEGDFNPYHIWFNNKSKALRVKKLISKL
jgi:hypothetical protein|tara:strand:- start:950 stop:1192 length:243 start_codon:yes stop_codon:yes gene_type:complete